MGPTPLYDALRAFANTSPLRLHMPGHKGRTMPLPELSPLSPLDFTELPPTGDLFAGDGPIRQAEDLWAKAVGMEHCLFLTGGSTQGMLAALTLATQGTRAAGVGGPNEQDGGVAVLLDRGSHRSAYNALALLDLLPVYLERPWLPDAGVLGPISPQTVERHLKNHPEIKTICITSPTYYGVLSDIPAIAQVVHSHGGTLVVDGAHGAHLPFLDLGGFAAADLVVMSAHKTLPALGQSALLFAGSAFPHAAMRQVVSLYGSSSPSYVLMASLDGARAWMEDEGASAYRETVAHVRRLRAQFPSLSDGDAPLDPARFVLCTGDGFGLQKRLQAQGIYPEMADGGHVVFILTCADGERDFARLERALGETAAGACPRPTQEKTGTVAPPSPPPTGGTSPKGGGNGMPCLALPPEPELVLSPRQARFSHTQAMPLGEAQGRVCACQIAPYPPGVPVLAPGERIGKKHLAYLAGIGYNMEEEVQVVAPKEGFV